MNPSPPECRRRSPAALIDDVFEEILLRIPPAYPACLIRLSLVCKSWSRLLSDPGFIRRYRVFHGTPPLLGFFFNQRGPGLDVARFVPTSSFCLSTPNHSDWYALDSRHGRVLFHALDSSRNLIVWDPMTGGQCGLRLPDFRTDNWNAAVLCAAVDCNHIHCHGGPFLVAFVGTGWEGLTCACVFSSEAGAWGDMTFVEHPDATVQMKTTLLLGNVIYFPCDWSNRIIEYDIVRRKLAVIDTPVVDQKGTVLVTTEGGGLGCAVLQKFKIHLWAREAAGPNGAMTWAQRGVLELKTLLLPRAFSTTIRMIGFACGIRVIFVSTGAGIFTIELGSGNVKKLYRTQSIEEAIPFMTFYCTGTCVEEIRQERPL